MPPTSVIPLWPPARPAALPSCRPPRTAAPGCARCGTGSTAWAPTAAPKWPWPWSTRSPAWGRIGWRGWKPPSAAIPPSRRCRAAAGAVLAERQLWGKARRPLEIAAKDAQLQSRARRQAWRALARLATEEGDDARALDCLRQAAAQD